MRIKVKNKFVNISDETIKKYQKAFDLTQEKAIEMYLEEEGYLENEEIEELTQKAKENKSVIHEAKSEKARKPRTVNPTVNPRKELLIDAIYTLLAEMEHTEQVRITNKTKLIEFIFQGKEFKVDLVEKRTKKEGK